MLTDPAWLLLIGCASIGTHGIAYLFGRAHGARHFRRKTEADLP